VAELAAAPPGPVPAERIAEAQSIPRRFLDDILLQLRRGGPG
jgi:DNA-binding IscR family transcriptional regulator